jgi:hypothetical protein
VQRVGDEAGRGRDALKPRSKSKPKASRPKGGRPPSGLAIEASENLPESYATTRLVLLPIDPYTLHAFWDLTRDDQGRRRKPLGEGSLPSRAVLRVYDVTGVMFDGSNAHGSFDVDIDIAAGRWYIPLSSPEKSYLAELGYRTEDGQFLPLVRSETVHAPRARPASGTDEQYLMVTAGEDLPFKVTEHASLPEDRISRTKRESSAIRNPDLEGDRENPPPIETKRATTAEDPLETLRKKLAGLYGLGTEGPSYPSPVRSENLRIEDQENSDLTALSERGFSLGISSR